MALASNKDLLPEPSIKKVETRAFTSNQRCTLPGFYKSVDDPDSIIEMVKNQAFPTLRKNKTTWVMITQDISDTVLQAKAQATKVRKGNDQKKR